MMVLEQHYKVQSDWEQGAARVGGLLRDKPKLTRGLGGARVSMVCEVAIPILMAMHLHGLHYSMLD